MSDELRAFFMQMRARLIAELCELEDLLGLPRSVKSRDERRRERE